MKKMRKHVYGTTTAFLFPISVLIFGIMDYTTKMDIAHTLTVFLPVMILSMMWHGGHNNIIKISTSSLTTQNAYFPWIKRKEVDFDDVQRVFVEGGTRFGPTTFTCFLKDSRIFEFSSRLVRVSETKKIIGNIEQHGILVETHRI